MLDVHPPHAPAHTWRDFFIHIATIVVGLLIAIGLEQTVEGIHRHHQRHQLEEDLRAEAESRIPLIDHDLASFGPMADWYGEVLKSARSAPVAGGFVTFTLPAMAPPSAPIRPPDSVWNAAVASGLVVILPHQQIEVWSRVNYFASLDAKYHEEIISAGQSVDAVSSRLGVRLDPGASLHLTPADRDELMRSVAVLYEKSRTFNSNLAGWKGASDAAAHGAHTDEEMMPYIHKAAEGVSR
ncbi:MAG: hypothetical protein V4555_11655 [Acidobacteriota bacterium]